MTNLVKKITTRFRSAEGIASSYSGYEDFAAKATGYEKEQILKDVIGKANKMQKEVATVGRQKIQSF